MLTILMILGLSAFLIYRIRITGKFVKPFWKK